jgi:VWFA-related protein
VDAVVTDTSAQAKLGLTVGDFALQVDAKSMPITSFRYVTQSSRRFVIVVDDAALSLAGTDRVRRALTAFVNQQMSPQDEAAILRTRSGSGVSEAISADRQLLNEAIGQIEFSPVGNMTGAQRDEFVLVGMTAELRRALAGLNAVPGRKAVVLISENLKLARQHPDRFKSFASLAADASAVYYGVDLGDTSGGIELDSLMLAGDTGGLNLGPDPGIALQRVLRDQEGYYLVGYQAPDYFLVNSGGSADPFAGRLLMRQTKLEVSGADLLARSRTSPVGRGAVQDDFSVRTPIQELAAGINSPFAGSAIHTLVHGIFTSSATLGSLVNIQVWLDIHDLTFTHHLNGTHHASAQVMIAAFGNVDLTASQTTYNLALHLTGEEYQKALRIGWVAQGELPIQVPGAYQLRTSVRDDTSNKMGAANQLIAVPDLSSGDLLLSGVALFAKDYTTIDAGPARRIFAPGTIVDFSYQILNPTVEQGKSTATESMLELFRENEQIFVGSPQILPAAAVEDQKRRSMIGELRLGTKLKAGRYWLKLTVTEKAAKTPRHAEQWVDFQVRP